MDQEEKIQKQIASLLDARNYLLHQTPTDGADYRGFHFHIQCHPPLRKPQLLKYLAGPETGGGNFLSDTRPEAKAAELRAVPDVHYRHA